MASISDGWVLGYLAIRLQGQQPMVGVLPSLPFVVCCSPRPRHQYKAGVSQSHQVAPR